MSTLLDAIHESLQRSPKQWAFRCNGDELTWSELDRAADLVAKDLARTGLKPGDRVACGLGAGLELPVRLLAHLRARLIHVPVNTCYRRQEIDHLFELTKPAACVGLATKAQPGDAHDVPNDAALILATSGTTGLPKGVLHTHQSLHSGIGSLTELWGWSPDDQQVLALPLFHVHGLGIGLLGALLRRVPTQLLTRFRVEEVCQAMAAGGTLFMGVPTMYVALVDHFDAHPEAAKCFKNARLCCAGSASLSIDILRRFEDHTGHRILERYGMSETLITISNPLDGERRTGAIGYPIPGVEIHIDGENQGELWVRGPTLMHSYWQDAAATRKSITDGWFRTGDRVRRDDDGYLYHQGRLTVDWIKSGGWRIGTKELETLLEQHPNVEEVAVFGLPDHRWGELVAAAVVLSDEIEDPTAVLEAFLEPQIANYKTVRHWRFLDQLPRNAMGKIQKRSLIDS